MTKKAAFLSLGCKVNAYETEAMRGLFEEAGYEIVDFKEQADIYVVNTCTVTNIADRKSRQMLHQARKRNSKAVIAAVGCYVQSAEKVLLEDHAVDLVVGNNRKSDIVAMVEQYLNNKEKEKLVVDIRGEQDYEVLQMISTMEKTRAFIKIQDGCNRYCSYCIIPYVRGRVRSRKEEEVLLEVEALAQKGYQEIVLTGIHISSYGTDWGEGSKTGIPLAELIINLSRIKGIKRIRLGSLEPGIITEEFVKRIMEVKQFCPHFHLSLQSGSNSVLERMNRKYSAEEYYEKVMLLRSCFENPAFTTDVIVGFPGETREEFEQTLQFVKRIGFSHIHVFKYSKRAGTKAAAMDRQVEEELKSRRSEELIALSERMAKEYRTGFLGKIEEILFEEEIELNGQKYQLGHNKRYLKLAVLSKEDLSNKLLPVKIECFLTEDILQCKIIH